eukprot:scaffold100713_cov24-Tisochrysis_lutea.AAC.3
MIHVSTAKSNASTRPSPTVLFAHCTMDPKSVGSSAEPRSTSVVSRISGDLAKKPSVNPEIVEEEAMSRHSSSGWGEISETPNFDRVLVLAAVSSRQVNGELDSYRWEAR